MSWIHVNPGPVRIKGGSNRADCLVNRMLGIEKAAHAELLSERAATQKERAAVAELVKENRFIQRMLDDRDRQFAELQAEFVAMRRDWVWRIVGMVRSDLRRIRRLFRPAAGNRAGPWNR